MDPARGAVRPVSGIVLTPIHCRRCGYNLYGLSADGPCPECGLDAWESILHTVDPAASRLPRIRNPAAVGNALLWLIVFVAAGLGLLVVRPLMRWIDAMDPVGLSRLADWTPPWFSMFAGVIGAAALFWVRAMRPQAGEDPHSPLWRDIRWLGFGVVGWATLILAMGIMELVGAPRWVAPVLWLAIAGAAVVGLLGLRGVLKAVGLRSREYRTARGGRQGIRAMIAAIIGAAIGQVLRLLALWTGVDVLAALGIIISSICTLMVVIGLAYLVVNTWWIRRSLRCPPPRLQEVLGPERE